MPDLPPIQSVDIMACGVALCVLCSCVIGAAAAGWGLSESQLCCLERIRMREVTRRLNASGTTVHGFYHTSNWRQHWQGIIEEQLRVMDGQQQCNCTGYDVTFVPDDLSLLSISQGVHITASGSLESEIQQIAGVIHNTSLRHRGNIVISHAKTVPRGTFKAATPEGKEALRNQGRFGNLTEGECSTVTALHAFCKAEASNMILRTVVG